ncbi:MAG: peptidase M20, partial [Anaerolineales bacterium]|nr:peptidase M20 [Anaerolineales bacterium]
MSQSEIYAQIDAHIEANLDYWIEQLARLVNQRSISAQNDGIDDCAQLVAAMLQEQGFTAEVMPSAGYPVVYGEGNGRSDKTLLFYLHYDVQ